MSSPDLSALRIQDQHRNSAGGRKTGWIVAVIVLLVIVAGALLAFRPKVDAVEVMTVHASSGDKPATLLNASGYVTPRRRSTIAAKITARVTNVYTDEGMRVKAGQILATLDDSDARVRLNSAKADLEAAKAQLADLQVNLANAETELSRSERLVKGGVSTQQSLTFCKASISTLLPANLSPSWGLADRAKVLFSIYSVALTCPALEPSRSPAMRLRTCLEASSRPGAHVTSDSSFRCTT